MQSDPENPHANLNPSEQAFVEAHAGYTFHGLPLGPYAPAVRVAAQAMGMIYPFVPEEGAAQHTATGMYPGQLWDIICLLWLLTLKCSLDLTLEEVKAKVWTPMRAFSHAQEAREVALAWAAQIGMVDTTTPIFAEALQVFMAIVQGVDVSDFRLQVEGEAAFTGEDDSKKV